MASKIVWLLVALAGGGCASTGPLARGFDPPRETRVIADVIGYGPGNRLWVRSCAVGASRFGAWLHDCAVEARPFRIDGPSVGDRKEVAAETPASPPPTAGTLGVLSIPPGALIAVDGKDAGQSPVIVRQVAPGTHGVRAVWPDGVVAAVDQEVVAGRTAIAHLFRP
jgi:hypothetical protein